MEEHRTLSHDIPRIAPPRLHARTQSRSPTRNRQGDDLLSDLSPATTLEAFTNPSGKLKASIEAATPSERAFGIRATIASKKIQEWVLELTAWPWPAEGGSIGFQTSPAKRRKLFDPAAEHRPVLRTTDEDVEEAGYIGALLAKDVDRYEDRIDEITEEMDELNVEEIKRQVLDTHFSPKSRPSSSASNAPPMPSLFASYTKMDDFTAVVTATVLHALPNLSRLMRLMDVWTIRLTILRKVPPLLAALDDAEIALRNGWNAITSPRQDHTSEEIALEDQTLPRKTFLAMMDRLRVKVTNLGKGLDFMLDTLEGREDTLPDNWLDRMDLIERNYGEWVVAGDRKVREGEWAIMEKKRREEEEVRRLKEAALARLEAEQRALEAARLKAEKEAEEAEALRLEAIAQEAQLKAEAEVLEAARLKALSDAKLAEAARIETQRQVEALDAARQRSEEEEALKFARMEELRGAELMEAARIEAAKSDAAQRECDRIEADRRLENAESYRTEQELVEVERLQVDKELAEAERLRIKHTPHPSSVVAEETKSTEAPQFLSGEQQQEEEFNAGHEPQMHPSQRDKDAQEPGLQRSEGEAREVLTLKGLQDIETAELTRLQAEIDAKALRLQQAPRDLEEEARLEAEQSAELARIQAQHSPKIPTLRTERDFQGAPQFESTKDAEIPKKPTNKNAELEEHAQLNLEKPSQSTKLEPRRSLADLQFSDPSRQFLQVAEIDTMNHTSMESYIDHCAPTENDVASSDTSVQFASPGAVESSPAALDTESEHDDVLCQPPIDETNTISAQIGEGFRLKSMPSSHSLFTGCKTGHLVPLDLSSTGCQLAEDESTAPRETGVIGSGIEAPVKFDAVELPAPSLGSPIHFDKHFDGPRSPSLEPPDSFQFSSAKSPKSPSDETSIPVSSHESSDVLQPGVSVLSGDIDSSPTLPKRLPPVKINDSSKTAPTASVYSVYDGAADSVVSNARRNSVGTGWIVVNASGTDGEKTTESVPLQHLESLSGDSFANSYNQDNINSDNNVRYTSGYAAEAGSTECLDPITTPTNASFSEIDDSETFNEPFSSPLEQGEYHEGFEDSSILSPVAEEELMPSIEVDSLDGSCAACDAYMEDDDEDVLPYLNRDISIGRFGNELRRISMPHRDSISSDTSTIITSRITELPSSPMSPQLDSSILHRFREESDQSPSAGRVRQRSQRSYELSPPPSPSATPRLLKQRSLQVLKTPGFGSDDPTAPSTPLDAPTFDNIDVTTAPLIASPRKANNDEQLQQQISSLLETIPARIRLTSDPNSTASFTNQTMRPKKTRRSVTPSFRPSSSMSNYSTYSRAPTPSFTLAPAFSKTTQRSRGAIGNPEIKLYHLSRSTGEAPIKLFVRLVGENGERVMVRVGGGWADLGEYLKEYASHHGRRSTIEGAEKIEIQDLPSRVVSNSSIASNTTVRENGRSTPFNRPGSVIGNRPGSSLTVRKTRKSLGATDSAKVPARVSDIRNEDRSPSTPLPMVNRRPYDTPPSATSIASSSASGPSSGGERNSRLGWAEEESSLGLAGPKAKKIVISERDQEWVDSMKEKVKVASAEKERRNRERERLDRERERKTSLGEMDRVGGTKRLFRKSLADKAAAAQKNT
jgi:hypothetical protein